jgi:hypothetical protein
VQQRPNQFDGFSYRLTKPSDLEQLDISAAYLLEPVQVSFFKDYPKSMTKLVKRAAKLKSVPNLAKWLASLWNTPPTLEIHTTSDLYDMNAVWLRFAVAAEDEGQATSAWAPAINLLDFRNIHNLQVPDLLAGVYKITGEINHNGYGTAGRLHYPDRVADEVSFYETLYNDKAFYRLPDMAIFWAFHGEFYESEEERRKFGLYRFDQGLDYFLNLYFGALLEQRELCIDRQGQLIR